MPTCTRKGCGQPYEVGSVDGCRYHPGGPVFHEGLKSWSCCKDMNKPVIDFDAFMKIPGCAEGQHTDAKPEPASGTSTSTTQPSAEAPTKTVGKDGVEVYGTPLPVSSSSASEKPSPSPKPLTPRTLSKEEEKDDVGVPVPKGTRCKRTACGKEYVSEAESRGGKVDEEGRWEEEGEEDGRACRYHPGQPVFHEGSKGYTCCKRRVMDFDDFLNIKGCRLAKSGHLFIGSATSRAATKEADAASREGLEEGEEPTECRIDHYQTPGDVRVSVFAKGADPEKSRVEFGEEEVLLSIHIPGTTTSPSPKRYHRRLSLYGPIDPTSSSFTFMRTKVELVLVKKDNRSWNTLQRLKHSTVDLGRGYGPMNLTFGATGRTGTVGGREMVLQEDNKLKR